MPDEPERPVETGRDVPRSAGASGGLVDRLEARARLDVRDRPPEVEAWLRRVERPFILWAVPRVEWEPADPGGSERVDFRSATRRCLREPPPGRDDSEARDADGP